jgi:regulator of sirC expression with transglutaminase-like and TPR domain
MDFAGYALRPDCELELLDGALLIAKDAYPNIDLDAERQRLDELAAPLIAQEVGMLDARAQVVALGAHLNGDCGFRGNQDDYYNPDNSFLNVVLERRVGIPISLAVIYIEVARRSGIHASGVGFPGHFLVRVEDVNGFGDPVIVDPFTGRALNRRELKRLLSLASNDRLKFDPAMLETTPTRHIVARMLMNLRGIYASRGDYSRLLVVLDRLIDVVPDAVEELRDRGFLWARLGAPEAAIEDLRRYAELFPHADDVEEVRRVMELLEKQATDCVN